MVRENFHKDTHIQIHTHTYVHTLTHTHINTYTCTHINTYTCTHINTYTISPHLHNVKQNMASPYMLHSKYYILIAAVYTSDSPGYFVHNFVISSKTSSVHFTIHFIEFWRTRRRFFSKINAGKLHDGNF